MGEAVTLRAADEQEVSAWVARPEGTVRGGLVVAQDAFGISPYIRAVCTRAAAEGYAAIAPALYDRQQPGFVSHPDDPETSPRARELRRGLVWDLVLLDVAAAAQAVAGNGRVGIIGFCVGGSVAWLAASASEVAAAVCYYPTDIGLQVDITPRCPTLLQFGAHDDRITPDIVARVRAAHPDVPAYVYDAGHGFDAPRASGSTAASALAWRRTVDFLRAHVG